MIILKILTGMVFICGVFTIVWGIACLSAKISEYINKHYPRFVRVKLQWSKTKQFRSKLIDYIMYIAFGILSLVTFYQVGNIFIKQPLTP